MALRKVRGNFERMFDKNLTDLVRGIRNNKENEARKLPEEGKLEYEKEHKQLKKDLKAKVAKYITQCVEEIKHELRQENVAVKSNAVAKLTYLQMLGYDITWAAFNVIEVMSSPKFTYKRIGYLCASQSFTDETEVLMLTTNMIRKDLNSQSIYDAGTALSGLACFITTDLARDLANDIMTLLTSTKPYIRKKSVLIMYKVFLRFPDALRPAFSRLKDKLEDPDPGVQSAAVNVICELARKNPKNYLSLAPIFFKLMTSSTNNWMLIKIIKLFGALTPLEPRLGKKLIEPLTNLIHSTTAMSLLYECVNTVIAVLISISSGMPNHSASIQLCVQKLRILIEDSDQNLKYLGLLAMSKILKTHPKSVQSHKDLILQCLDDKDESIRLRALDLLYGMVSKKNLMEIVKKLMIHMDRAEGTTYRDELLSKIIEICSQNNFQFITNFEWYVSILVELTRMESTRHGQLIASQMLDVAVRVPAVRKFTVSQMALILENAHLLIGNAQRNSICEVLYAASWICGEFCSLVPDPQSTLYSLLKPKVTSLPGHIQSVYVQNIMKFYAQIVSQVEEDDDNEKIHEVGLMLVNKLLMFEQSSDLEACSILQLLKYIMKLQGKGEKVAADVNALFNGELNPVAPKAQKKVPIPEGLDLDEWINDPPSESSEEEVFNDIFIKSDGQLDEQQKYTKYEPTDEELYKMREARKVEQANNPHYLKPAKSNKVCNYQEDIEEIPVTEIDLSVPLYIPGKYDGGTVSPDTYFQNTASSTKSRKKKKKSKKNRKGHEGSVSSDEEPATLHVVNTAMGEMPEGARSTDEDDDDRNIDDPHRALDIDLEEPLRDDEKLPVGSHRISNNFHENEPSSKEKKKHEKLRKKKSKDKHKEKKHKKRSSNLLRETSHDTSQDLMERRGEYETPETTTNIDNSTELVNNKEENDVDFWLKNESEILSENLEDKSEKIKQVPPNTLNINHSNAIDENIDNQVENNVGSDEFKKKKRDRKPKKERRKHSSKKEHNATTPKDKSEYEEALGLATPSKEKLDLIAQTPSTPSMPPTSSYKLLAADKQIKLVYETRTIPQNNHQVIVSVVFSNICNNQIKELNFNVLNSVNTQLVRDNSASVHDGINIPFQLPAGVSNEGQFAFIVDSIIASQSLRGTLTYMIVTPEGSTHEKIDFKLALPTSSFMIGTLYKRDTYAELLSSGDLSAKESISIMTSDLQLSELLAKIFVEQLGMSASLYSRSIQGDHVCLLVKAMPGDKVNIDGKCTDSRLLSSLLNEISSLLNVKSDQNEKEKNFILS
ncbi:AP-3 complex subunit delta-1 [Nymphon striatum]|nr:AP-3 complex subunit delta-1 [Nymphon striatum]